MFRRKSVHFVSQVLPGYFHHRLNIQLFTKCRMQSVFSTSNKLLFQIVRIDWLTRCNLVFFSNLH